MPASPRRPQPAAWPPARPASSLVTRARKSSTRRQFRANRSTGSRRHCTPAFAGHRRPLHSCSFLRPSAAPAAASPSTRPHRGQHRGQPIDAVCHAQRAAVALGRGSSGSVCWPYRPPCRTGRTAVRPPRGWWGCPRRCGSRRFAGALCCRRSSSGSSAAWRRDAGGDDRGVIGHHAHGRYPGHVRVQRKGVIRCRNCVTAYAVVLVTRPLSGIPAGTVTCIFAGGRRVMTTGRENGAAAGGVRELLTDRRSGPLPAGRQPGRRAVAPWSTRMPTGRTPSWAGGVTADRPARRAAAKRPIPWQLRVLSAAGRERGWLARGRFAFGPPAVAGR